MGNVIVHTIDILKGFEALSEKPFSPEEFTLDVLKICGAANATLKKLSDGTSNKAKGLLGDILLQRKMYFRPSNKGQTGADLSALAVDALTKKYKPRLLIACDGEDVSVLDTKRGTPTHFAWKDLPKHYDLFWPLAGHEVYEGHEETKADRDAAYALSKLYDAIIDQNPDWDGEARQHDLNLLMTRLLFCMFAEDTGIFDDHLFTRYVADYTDASGGNVNTYLDLLFSHLNTADGARKNVPDWLDGFHYVNGGLFRDKVDIPYFSKRARRYLIDAAELNWADINPDIFGTMIQAVVAPKMRGDLGMHYTSVENIMKVIHPLFLMSLEEAFDKAQDSRKKLEVLLSRLSKIRIFDPACGSGNFLIIAYQKLRELEMRVFQRLEELSGNRTMGFSRISLDNFYGIEIADFAAETAKLSLWIAEYQMNQKFKSTFGDAPPDLPLRDGGHIVTDNALRVDWLAVCPPSSDDLIETYVCGNPPYLGFLRQTEGQKNDMLHTFQGFKAISKLDLVACWFMNGSRYLQKVPSKLAFVSTNSICQGEQVGMLWPAILSNNVDIHFCHLSFLWKNVAKSNAAVTCIIVGLSSLNESEKYIFDNKKIRKVERINGYLLPAKSIYVEKHRSPISQSLPKISLGSSAYDGGGLMLTKEEREELLTHNSEAKKFIKKFIGSGEFLQDIERYCIWVEDQDVQEARNIQFISDRFDRVTNFRSKSKRSNTFKAASRPNAFSENRHVSSSSILVPIHFSENREYIAVGFTDDKVIIPNSARAIYDAQPYIFSILSSLMHRVWVQAVGGRIKTDFRYSAGVCYNAFPLPKLNEREIEALTNHCWAIIEAREQNFGQKIGKMYNYSDMPESLLSAHRALDETLEKIYIGRPFKDDIERLEYLFKLYLKMTDSKIQTGEMEIPS